MVEPVLHRRSTAALRVARLTPWLAGTAGWTIAGASTALTAVAACTDCIDVARRRADLLTFACWLVAIYATAFAGAGLLAVALERGVRRARGRRDKGQAPPPSWAAATAAHLAAAAIGVVLLSAAGIAARASNAIELESTKRLLALLGAMLAAGGVAVGLPRLTALFARRQRAAIALLLVVPGVAAVGLALPLAAGRWDRAPGSAPRLEPTPAGVTALGGPVLLFAIDGADWRRMDPLLDQGRLPNLAKLIARGVRAPLSSVKPSLSPLLWNSVATGADASVHGVLGFTEMRLPGLPCGVQRLPSWGLLHEVVSVGTRRGRFQVPVTACRRQVKPLWTILGEHDRRVAVINWYATWPAEPVNGYLVSDRNPRRAAFHLRRMGGRLPAETGIVHPAELWPMLASLDVPDLEADEVLALPLFGDLDSDQRAKLARDRNRLEMLGLIHLSDRFTAEVGLALLRLEPLDFTALFFAGVDHYSHRVGALPEVIDRYYEYVDGVLGRALAALPAQATVFVVSDHGWSYEASGSDRDQVEGHGAAPDGIFIAAGAPIRPGAALEAKPALVDIAPTILGVYGLPASLEMSGRVLDEILEPAARARVPSTRVATYGAPPIPRPSSLEEPPSDQDEETLRKLRALGYIK